MEKPKQYVLKKDFVIPKGTILNNAEGEHHYLLSGMYSAQLEGKNVMIYINDDILLEDKKLLAEVK